jgi:hypothetical protein
MRQDGSIREAIGCWQGGRDLFRLKRDSGTEIQLAAMYGISRDFPSFTNLLNGEL